jgi:hypothetical protein
MVAVTVYSVNAIQVNKSTKSEHYTKVEHICLVNELFETIGEIRTQTHTKIFNVLNSEFQNGTLFIVFNKL